MLSSQRCVLFQKSCVADTQASHLGCKLNCVTVEHQLTIQNTTLAPTVEWSPHGDGWIMVRVERGLGYCVQKKGACELNCGDGFISPGNSDAVIRASQLDFLQLQYFWIQAEFMKGLMTVNEWLRLGILQRNSSCLCFFKSTDLTGKKFASIAQHLGNDSLPFRCSLLQLWGAGIAALLDDSHSKSDSSIKLIHRFRQLIGKMPELELSRYSVSELAGQLDCSERHFCRIFRRAYGVPFQTHQLELRLQHACELLKDPSKKIASISHEINYRSTGIFNTMFKNRYGVTPTEWRRQNDIPSFGQLTRQPSKTGKVNERFALPMA